MSDANNLQERLAQAEWDKQNIQDNINEIKKEIKENSRPKKVDIYNGEVTVQSSGSYILVYGRDTYPGGKEKSGCPITVGEAKRLVKALETMIAYQESKYH